MKPLRYLIAIVFLLCGLSARGSEKVYGRDDMVGTYKCTAVPEFVLDVHLHFDELGQNPGQSANELDQYVTKVTDIHIETNIYSYQNASCIEYTVYEYTIINDSDIPYITFIYEGEKYENRDDDISRYFRLIHGDFSLLSLLTDNVVFSSDVAVVGKLFLKEIKPKSSFKYFFVTKSQDSHRDVDFLQDIYVERLMDIEDLLHVKLIDEVLYDEDEVIILL